MTKPYQIVIHKIHALAADTSQWVIEMELSDTANVSAQGERLSIVTRVSPPFPDHPQALELAALQRVQDLLDQQMKAMQST